MKIYLFSDSFGKNIGGMEVHQQAFMKRYPYAELIVRDEGVSVYKREKLYRRFKDIASFTEYIRTDNESRRIFFFNNLSCLTDIRSLRQKFSNDAFIIRSGGNDIYKALDKLIGVTLEEKLRIVAETINNFADKLIVNSDYSYFRNIDVGILPDKMIKLRGGVDRSAAEDNISHKHEIRRKIEMKYGIQGKKLLVIAARFVPFKGIEEFISCLAETPICSRCHLLLIGDGKQKKQIL